MFWAHPILSPRKVLASAPSGARPAPSHERLTRLSDDFREHSWHNARRGLKCFVT